MMSIVHPSANAVVVTNMGTAQAEVRLNGVRLDIPRDSWYSIVSVTAGDEVTVRPAETLDPPPPLYDPFDSRTPHGAVSVFYRGDLHVWWDPEETWSTGRLA